MVRVHRGREAVALVADPIFRRKWSALHEACPYGTCFQGIPFVTTWYRSYAERFEPVLVTGAVKESSLIGLLPLALSKEDNTLVPAGTDHAEYQVWLARDGQSNEFIESALDCLAREFPAGQLRFRYLPSGTPLSWTDRWTGRCHLRSVPRLLMSTRPGNTIAQSLRKRSMRSRLNRLERMGKLSFNRIVDPEEFASVLDEIIPLHDFRQGAAHLNFPFSSDRLKKPFHLAIMKHPSLPTLQCFLNTRWASFTFSSWDSTCKKRDSRTLILLPEGSNTRSGLLHIAMKRTCWTSFFAPPLCVNFDCISETRCALTLRPGYEQKRLWREFSIEQS